MILSEDASVEANRVEDWGNTTHWGSRGKRDIRMHVRYDLHGYGNWAVARSGPWDWRRGTHMWEHGWALEEKVIRKHRWSVPRCRVAEDGHWWRRVLPLSVNVHERWYLCFSLSLSHWLSVMIRSKFPGLIIPVEVWTSSVYFRPPASRESILLHYPWILLAAINIYIFRLISLTVSSAPEPVPIMSHSKRNADATVSHNQLRTMYLLLSSADSRTDQCAR